MRDLLIELTGRRSPRKLVQSIPQHVFGSLARPARDARNVSEVVASKDAHISVRKAADLLGLGYREVAVDASRRLKPGALGDLSTAALVLTASTQPRV